MDRYVVVSCDGHAGVRFRSGDPWEQYKPHMERKYQDELEKYVAEAARQVAARAPGAGEDPFGKAVRAVREKAPAYRDGGEKGLYDPAIRQREMDRDGVAGEVIFPQAIAFRPLSDTLRESYPYEFRLAGVQAYNRWLAEFCSYEPERHAGVAQILLDDVDIAVKEVQWARKAGLHGGIQLPLLPLYTNDPEAFYHHPRFEPLWAVCEELDMPVHSHIGGSTPNYGPVPTGAALRTFESLGITAHRAFWFLLFSGVLQRHPQLKLVFTETGGTWVPYTLDLMDELYENRNPELMRQVLPMKPSEYWARQCYIGASPPSGRREIEQRYKIGVRNLMWASDYPHPEGTWPYTEQRRKAMLAGVPEDEVRLILGENAINVYNFDKGKLAAIAQRIGPAVSTFSGAAQLTGEEYARLWREGMPEGLTAVQSANGQHSHAA